MKKKILRILELFCAASVLMSSLPAVGNGEGEQKGKMYSSFAYVLNDYMYEYGIMSTGEALYADEDGYFSPRGVVYSEIVNFDPEEEPYIIIFFAGGDNENISCHIWRYNESDEAAEQVTAFDIDRTQLTDGRVGVFSLGSDNRKRYITYRVYENDVSISSACYTAIGPDAFKYVDEPRLTSEIGVMDFSSAYFHSGIDISEKNASLEEFFTSLKNAAADSVTYEDIAERLSDEDEAAIERVLENALSFNNFDIADYTSMDEYKEALSKAEPCEDKFYLISEAYDLGDEIYYIRFSTDRSYYNYALLRRSDDAENGYQILKVRTDCIPLSDNELKQIKTDYDRSTLLYKKSKDSLKLTRKAKEGESDKTPVLSFDKLFNKQMRLPIICIGSGISIALLTILWVYLYSDD